ncbi:TonB-dependent siderophore receptor [Diaphorobacter nitroreducens]|uniref:TonB-dependent siderophore receptor n=1 Tax=Diaphorobacter nitroreducens TaxID=164759 RepID=UPI0035B271EE
MKTCPFARPRVVALAATTLCLAAQAQNLPEVKVTDSTATTEGSYIARSLDTGKTGARLRETPQSVSVITRQQLDDRNFTKVEDAVKAATGVTITRFDGAGNYNTIQSRGFDIGAVLVDGMPIAQGPNYATALDTAVYDRIEILRGPAGLLQGAGEPGGTINLVRKRALGPRAIGANVQLGSFGLRRADVDVTSALNQSGTLRGRVVAVKEDRNSYVDVLFNKKELGYGTLELDIHPATTLSVGFARQKARSVVDQGLPAYANGVLINAPRSTFAGVAANRQDMDTDDAFAELEHRLANGGLVKAAVREVKRTNFYRSGRANSAAAANGDYRFETVDLGGELSDRSYDLYLSTPFDLGGRQHKLLLGVNRNDRDTGDGNFAYGPTYAANVFRPNYNLAYPNIVLPGFTGVTTRSEDALYGQAQFSITERLKLIAGGRLSWAEVQSRRASDGAVTAQTKPGRQFTPQVSALYDINANLTAYASYVESFVVQSQLDAARNLLPPRTGKQVEFGVKGEFLNKRLQTQAAVFRIDDVNRAIADPVVTTASIPGGEVRSQGLELEASGQVMPGWDLLAGYAYTDTKYIKAPVAQQGQVFAPHTPRHLLNLSTRYAFRNAALRGVSVGGGVSWRSEFFAQSGAIRIASGNYALANLQVAWQINDQLNLSLNVDNLFDKTYYEKVSGVSRQNFYGEPRKFVLALKARY